MLLLTRFPLLNNIIFVDTSHGQTGWVYFRTRTIWKLKAPRLSVRLHKCLYDFSLVFNAESFQTKFHCVLGINVFNKLDM